jgi:hypothetical protein
MNVKAGQVWYHAGSQRDWEVIAAGKSCVIVAHGDAETPISHMDLFADFKLKQDVEPQQSDLEIVQKALMQEKAGIEFNGDGGWLVCVGVRVLASGDDTESLLAWTKQTIGDK